MVHPDEQFDDAFDDFKGRPEPPSIGRGNPPTALDLLREEYAAILIKELASWLVEGGLIMVSGTLHRRSQALPLMADQLARDVIKLREQPDGPR